MEFSVWSCNQEEVTPYRVAPTAMSHPWAMERKLWEMDDWYGLLKLFGSDGRVYIRRRGGEDYLPECVQQQLNFVVGRWWVLVMMMATMVLFIMCKVLLTPLKQHKAIGLLATTKANLNPIEHAWDILGVKMEDIKPKLLERLK